MSTIVVGTNVFLDCEIPFAIDRSPAVQVSTDERGALQLTVEITSPPASRPLDVRSNKAVSDGAQVSATPDLVRVLFAGVPVVEARRVGDVVHLGLDLRPLGLFVYSDESALHIGSSALSGNTISRSNVGILLSTGER